MAKVYLFGYGTLKKDDFPPRTEDKDYTDFIRGEMYDLGKFPAGINLGKGMARIKGETEEIDESELPVLDKRESPTFTRIKVKTERGYDAFVYQYNKPIPKSSKRIQSWEK